VRTDNRNMTLLLLFLLAAFALFGGIMDHRRPNARVYGQAAPAAPFALPFPYEHAGPLFSPAEQFFLGVLEQSVGAELPISHGGHSQELAPLPAFRHAEVSVLGDTPQLCCGRRLYTPG